MTCTIRLWCTTQFEALHRWAEAPAEVHFLRNYHRHIFHVRLEVGVTRLDRQVEFITLKRKLDDYLNKMWKGKAFADSCEMIAVDVLENFPFAASCTVSEDGENGATVTRV